MPFAAVLALVVIAAIAILFLLTAAVITSEPGREATVSTLTRTTGLALPQHSTPIVASDVRWRRDLVLWGAAGTAASAALLLVIDIDRIAIADIHMPLVGALSFATIAGLVGMSRRPRDVSAQSISHEGSPLSSVIGSLAITMGWVISLVTLTFVGLTVWLATEHGIGDRGIPDLIARISMAVAYSLASPAVIIVASAISNRRRWAASRPLLAWQDALLAQRTWALLLANSILAAGVVIDLGRVASGLIPVSAEFTGERIVMALAPMVSAGVIFAYALLVARTSPQRSFIRNVWPDAEAARP